MNVKELTHSQQQPQAPKTHKKRSQPSVKQSEQCSVPPIGLFLTESWSWMKSRARQTLSNRGLSEIHLRLVNLTEKCCMTLFQRLLVCCFENALTIDLLIF